MKAQAENYYEATSELNSSFENKANKLRNEIASDKKERDSNTANIVATISDEVSLIQGELFAERKAREENYDKIIKKLGLEVLRLNDTLNAEKKVREESHGRLQGLLGGMRSRLVAQVEVAKCDAGREEAPARQPGPRVPAARRYRRQSCRRSLIVLQTAVIVSSNI